MMRFGWGRTAVRCVVAAAAVVALAGTSGCSLLTPSLAEAPSHEAYQTVDDSILVSPGVLTVALNTSDAPQAMDGADGELEGYAVDVAHAIADRLGLDVAFVDASSPDDAIEDEVADIYLGATDEDGTSSVTVTGDYLETATGLFGPASAGAVSRDDLDGATIAVQAGSATQEVLSRIAPSAVQETCSNVNECFEALASGAVDYAACDATAGAYLARAHADIAMLGTLSGSTAFGVAYATHYTELGEAVSAAVAEISTDGTLDAIHAAWYGSMPVELADTLVSGVSLEDLASSSTSSLFSDDEDDAADSSTTDEEGGEASSSSTGTSDMA